MEHGGRTRQGSGRHNGGRSGGRPRTDGGQSAPVARVEVQGVGRYAATVDANRQALRRPLTGRDQAVLEHLSPVIPTRPTAIERALTLKKHSVQSTLSKLSQRGLATRTTGGWIRT